jgi:hypothetical protein
MLLATVPSRPVAREGSEEGVGESFLTAVNTERERRGLSPVHCSVSLTRLARDRAVEISFSPSMDFEPASGGEDLDRAIAYGYPAWFVQELVAVGEGDPCDLVAAWTSRFAFSDAYLRHEAKDVGIGVGVLGNEPVYVLIVGIPSNHDPLRDRLPGIAPREWLTARLFEAANRARLTAGLSPWGRSEDLDAEAQRLAEVLLDRPDGHESGSRPLADGGGAILYLRGRGSRRVGDSALALKSWLTRDRQFALSRNASLAGAGLASRGADDDLEAVWTLAVRTGR